MGVTVERDAVALAPLRHLERSRADRLLTEILGAELSEIGLGDDASAVEGHDRKERPVVLLQAEHDRLGVGRFHGELRVKRAPRRVLVVHYPVERKGDVLRGDRRAVLVGDTLLQVVGHVSALLRPVRAMSCQAVPQNRGLRRRPPSAGIVAASPRGRRGWSAKNRNWST